MKKEPEKIPEGFEEWLEQVEEWAAIFEDWGDEMDTASKEGEFS